MKHGLLSCAACAPDLRVADPAYNAGVLVKEARTLADRGVKIAAFPELCLVGCTASDLLFQGLLIRQSEQALCDYIKATADLDMLTLVGVPVWTGGRLYNCCAAVWRGTLLGLVPKTFFDNSGPFADSRYFAPAPKENIAVTFAGQATLLGTRQVFSCPAVPALTVGVEICHDLWAGHSPCFEHVAAGANLIVNLACTEEAVGKSAERRELVKAQSRKAMCDYLLCCAGRGESTTDSVFGGNHVFCSCGELLAECPPFSAKQTLSVTCDLLTAKTLRLKTPPSSPAPQGYAYPTFSLKQKTTAILTPPERTPFVPKQDSECDMALAIQANALCARMRHIGAKSLIFGISGGLDSTLAALVCVEAARLAGMDKSKIYAITMPCFGTTERTEGNAERLAQALGISFESVCIKEAVGVHLKDIKHPDGIYNAAYENAQARERTQVLMDLANERGGIVVGTGDLSELALGFATYNGDHMSMYGVNASVPKTLMRHMLSLFAERAKAENPALHRVLLDIVSTPISPELLPAEKGEISQCTEDIVGPYLLHDYFLWHMIFLCQCPSKVWRLACASFSEYTPAFIRATLETFIRRFFSQQFKRSCLPDGPKVSPLSLSPRAGFKMPSDASAALWLADLEEDGQ